jgi:beta-glucanase (GH16 family)
MQTAVTGYHSGQECFVNSPNNLSVSGGHLNLTVRAEAAPFTCPKPRANYTTQYTSGSVSSQNKFAQAYGRFAVRAKVPNVATKGLQESFWLWPENEFKYAIAWPTTGELDIAEVYHQYPDRAIPFIHYTPAASDPNVTNNYCMVDISQFHTYVLEWTTSTLTISIDGKTCLTDSWNPASPLKKPQPFDQPFFINLTQALGIGTNAFDAQATPLPATTQVDYVRVWK